MMRLTEQNIARIKDQLRKCIETVWESLTWCACGGCQVFLRLLFKTLRTETNNIRKKINMCFNDRNMEMKRLSVFQIKKIITMTKDYVFWFLRRMIVYYPNRPTKSLETFKNNKKNIILFFCSQWYCLRYGYSIWIRYKTQKKLKV